MVKQEILEDIETKKIDKSKRKKRISGFGIAKGMRSFTREDEFDSCIDKIFPKTLKFQRF